LHKKSLKLAAAICGQLREICVQNSFSLKSTANFENINFAMTPSGIMKKDNEIKPVKRDYFKVA
jgi:hypothetical protein